MDADAETGLGYSGPTVRYLDGITVLHQPEESRCVALCLMTLSTDDEFVTRTVARSMGVSPTSLVVVGVRENQQPHEAVWVGDYCDPEQATAQLGDRVAIAGSWIRNSYPVDSAEGAARTGVTAAAAILNALSKSESAPC